MIRFEALIKRFREKGEKSGWRYVAVLQEQADQLMPGNKKSFRVKGKMDAHPYEWITLVPMSDGSFIMPLNAEIRKKIKKGEGDSLDILMEPETREKPLCAELLSCLEDVPEARQFFSTLTKGTNGISPTG